MSRRLINHKAQLSFIDLLIGFTIFISIFLINYQSWSTIRIKLQNSELEHYFDTNVYDSVETLINTKGFPINWTDDVTNALSIGLSVRNNVLDYDKILALNNSDYDLIKDKILDTGDFELIISNDSGELFNIGKEPRGEVTRVERLIKINDNYYKFIFKGWRE